MNSPMRRCRHAQTPPSALISLFSFHTFVLLEVNLPRKFYSFQTATLLYYLKKPIETLHKSLYTSGGKETHKVNTNENLWRFGDEHLFSAVTG